MNSEQQQIAIAKACGKVNIHEEVHPTITYLWCGYAPEREIVPNYPFDLNAMHEAEKVLTEEQRRVFYVKLELVCDRDGTHPYDATAAQRAEAFLRAIKRWIILPSLANSSN